MQNISFLSFFTHLGINIFFSIKEKIFPNRGRIRAMPGLFNSGTNYVISIFLVGTIVCVNMLQFGNVLRSSLEPGSGYKRLASLFESQSVLAQNIALPYKNNSIATPENEMTACRIPQIDLAASSDTSDSATPAKEIAGFSSVHQYSTMVQPGDSLWTDLKRLLMDYAGDNPCQVTDTPNIQKNRPCQVLYDKKIDEMALRLLKENKMLSTAVRPGQTVWLDISGTIRIAR